MPSHHTRKTAAPRKVIKLDLASMLADDTLAGERQLSALDTPATSLPQGSADPEFLLEPIFKADPAPIMGGAVRATDSLQETFNIVDPGFTYNEDPEIVLKAIPGSDHKRKPGLSIPIRLHPVISLRDGLHPGEFELWELLRKLSGGESAVALGNAALRKLGQCGRSTVKRLLKTLQQKHCIRLSRRATMESPAEYEVLTEDAILAIWRRHGLSHVYRDRRAVALVAYTDPGVILSTIPGTRLISAFPVETVAR